MRIYRLKEEEGPLSWTVIFPAEKISEVVKVLEEVSRGAQTVRSPGMAMVSTFPGSEKVWFETPHVLKF